MKLTAATVRSISLPAGKSETILFDYTLGGFGLRVRGNGAKISRTFIYQYKIGNQQRRVTLGSVAVLDVGQARNSARTLAAKVRLGEDVAHTKNEARAEAAQTFKAVVATYLARQQARLRPRSFLAVEHHLLHHSRALHGLPLSKIDRRSVAAVIATVAETAGGVTGNRVRGTLSAFFSWCLANGLTGSNPIVGTAKPHTEVSRDRVLDGRELAAIWNAAGDDTYGSIIRVLMATGARASEVGGLMWVELDLDKGVASLPPERTKTARAHTIFLSAPAREILAAQPRRFRGDGTLSPWVFGARGPFSDWGVCKKNLDRRIAEMTGNPPVPWRTHDLRRSCATLMAAELSIEPFVIEGVLGHVSGSPSIARVYNRSDYSRERRIAIDRWGDWLIATVTGGRSNIIPFTA